MDLARRFDVLGRKQFIMQEGISMLRETQLELARARASADLWGLIGVTANAVLVPLNVIVNSCQLGSAKTAYQMLVRQMYGQFGKSGTRIENGRAKKGLSLVKRAIVEELGRKGLSHMIPGVNIIVGLAEDSLALWETARTVESGRNEMNARAMQLERQISAIQRQLTRIGIELNDVLERGQALSRTA